MKTSDLETTETSRFDDETRAGLAPHYLGWFSSIRHLLETIFALLEARIELFTIELKEAKARVFALTGAAVALVFLSFMTAVAMMATVVFLLWEHALAVVIGFSALFLLVAIGSFIAARSQLQKLPFEETVAQLKKDRDLMPEDRNGS